MRDSKRYTRESEKLRRNDVDITLIVDLKTVLAKKMTQRLGIFSRAVSVSDCGQKSHYKV